MAVIESNPWWQQEPKWRQYECHYRVVTDDPRDSSKVARNAPGIPARYSTFSWPDGSVDLGSFAMNATSRLVGNPDDSKRVWDVQVDFSTEPTEEADNDYDDPVNAPVEWSGGNVQRQSVVDRDQFGVIQNIAGDPFTDPPLADDPLQEIVVVKNYPNLTEQATWAKYRNAANDAPFWGYAANKLRVTDIRWQQLRRASAVPYIRTTFRFLVDDDTHQFNIWQRGFNKLKNPANPAEGRERILTEPDANGDQFEITEAAFLDVNGQPIPPDGIAANAITLDINYYPLLDFTMLGLPANLGDPS